MHVCMYVCMREACRPEAPSPPNGMVRNVAVTNEIALLFMSFVDRIFQCSIATQKQFLNLRLKGNV